ncbi:Trypsin domain containing protein, partial [Asbolus verrucosus]
PVRNVVPFRNSAVRIINGDEATKGQFPWQAAIFVSFPGESNVCGGAVINEEWILTAGHCVYGASSFRIDLGSTLLIGDDPDRMPFTTDQYILHEEYNPSTLANDVAVIRLPKLVTFNDYIKPIALASRELEAGITVTASGWGLTSDGGDASDIGTDVKAVTLQAFRELRITETGFEIKLAFKNE